MSITLIETENAALVARGYNLALKVVSNIPHVLTEKDLDYWEKNLPKLKKTLAKALSRTSEVIQEVKEKAKRFLKPFITLTTSPSTKEQLVADIEANKNNNDVPDEVSNYAKSMMEDENYIVSEVLEEVSFVALALGADLGFTAQPQTIDFMTDEFCQRWSEENLDGYVIELCKSDDGPRIRKAWTHQPKDTVVWCAMKRLIGSDRDPGVWRLECDSVGRRWLSGSWARPMRHWNLGDRVVFRLRKI